MHGHHRQFRDLGSAWFMGKNLVIPYKQLARSAASTTSEVQVSYISSLTLSVAIREREDLRYCFQIIGTWLCGVCFNLVSNSVNPAHTLKSADLNLPCARYA